MQISDRSVFLDNLLGAIEKAPVVVLFRHQHPDMDALGSQKGLQGWLKERYPEKKILAAGLEGEGMDEVRPEDLKEALAIITDTSNADRIDDARWAQAKTIARIDHHVRIEEIGDLDFVDVKAAASCELVALLLRDAGQHISPATAQWLLQGLMTDSQRFTIGTVRPETFEAGAYLIGQGADPVKARITLFSRPLAEKQYCGYLSAKAKQQGKFLFAISEKNAYLQYGLGYDQARSLVDALSGVAGMEVWALFTEDEDGIHYAASLRSNTISIRDLAEKYHGGGHECACGIKNLSGSDVRELIELLTERSVSQ